MTDDTYALPPMRLSRREIFSFAIARKLLASFEGTPLEMDMRSVLDKIADSVEGHVPRAAGQASGIIRDNIDVSTDGSGYTNVLDQSTNTVVRNTYFGEIPPAKCRFFRLTMINWPRATPLGIIEFTIIGKPERQKWRAWGA